MYRCLQYVRTICVTSTRHHAPQLQQQATCMKCLHQLRLAGSSWDPVTYISAARGGHIQCLQYAHTHGCRWTLATSEFAAANGRLECLQYAHTNGCPGFPRVSGQAIQAGQQSCVKYLCNNGWPLPCFHVVCPDSVCTMYWVKTAVMRGLHITPSLEQKETPQQVLRRRLMACKILGMELPAEVCNKTVCMADLDL